MKLPLYFDYAATTPIAPEVSKLMHEFLTSNTLFANAGANYSTGEDVQYAIQNARKQVATVIQAEPEEIIWTSGATESVNLALKGAMQMYQSEGRHLITVSTEHSAVIETCHYLEKQGYQVTYLTPEKNGFVDLIKLEAAIRDDTVLISVMHVNNETGVIQDILGISELAAKRGVLFHVDAAQSIGRLELNVKKTPVDLISLSSHKQYGPKGMGALYVRRKPRIKLSPLIHGGGQEQGMRSGTLATHQIIGMGLAYELAEQLRKNEYVRIELLRNHFVERLSSHPLFFLNSDRKFCVPHIINFGFKKMHNRQLLKILPEVLLSIGSTCQSKGVEGSYVLRAMGVSEEASQSSLRVSFGRQTTMEQVDFLANLLLSKV